MKARMNAAGVFMFVISMVCGIAWANAANNTPPASPVKLIFIHHSTGGNWLADPNSDQPYGGLGSALMTNNYYVSATNYGWGPDGIGDNTDIPNWPSWFTGSNSSTILSAVYSETGQNVGDFGEWSRLSTDPGGENRIIMFKSCFPNSNLFGNPTDTAASSPDDQFTVSNAKAVYNNLLTYFQTRTDKLFIVITAPPANENEYAPDYQTPAERAANARAFNNWLVNDWLDSYSHNNVAVFDYFNVLTGTDNHHRWYNNAVQHVTNTPYNFSAYPNGEWDSHPNTTGQQKATAEFVDLLNYYYNRWATGQTSSGSTDKVNFSQLTMSSTGMPLTVTVNASSSTGKPLYYKFYYCANYGTPEYETTKWTVVQNYSTTNSAEYSFTEPGSYVIVVRAVVDPSNEPDALPIIGHVVTVPETGEVLITGLTSSATSTPNVGDPVTFTATASDPSGGDVYYCFYYCGNYGTSAYATTKWTKVQDYSTSNTCQYTFPAAGDYVVVVRAVTDPSNEPEALPIIGQTISVNQPLQVTSTAFANGGTIPVTYSCDGSDVSPPLAFGSIPSQTQSIALICDDPDAPGGTFVHWVLFNLPASTTALAQNVPSLATLDNGARQGTNDFGNYGYGGPCPPAGTHRYYFKAYALDTVLTLDPGITKSQLVDAMEGHILAQGQLMGMYGS